MKFGFNFGFDKKGGSLPLEFFNREYVGSDWAFVTELANGETKGTSTNMGEFGCAKRNALGVDETAILEAMVDEGTGHSFTVRERDNSGNSRTANGGFFRPATVGLVDTYTFIFEQVEPWPLGTPSNGSIIEFIDNA